MEDSKLGLFKFLLPKVPLMAWAGARHSLYLSPTSTKWDLRTELQVTVLRAMMSGTEPTPLGRTQALTLKDGGAKGKLWAARTHIPAPEDDGSREAVFRAIEEMGDGTETYVRPESADLRAEWIGHRGEAKSDEEALPDISEEERYAKLMAEPERKSKTTVLYFHGGAYYLCGFGTHRQTVARLAKTCGGRALLVEYRLAPQAAFPSQLIDALNAYLYLLYPPEGAMHESVPAEEIVFAGDSAGGNLSLALLQLLLQLHRSKGAATSHPIVAYNGKQVEVPLPAGVSAQSGWFDISRSQKSLETNAKYDYLPVPNHDDTLSRFPADDIWPTTPPRGDIFCDLSMLCHPLVSPVAAKDWSGAPPLWIMTGEEMLTDEDAILASTAVRSGVTVEWEQYEAMPHVFAMLMPHVATSQRCYDSLGSFCRRCVEGEVESRGTWIAARTGKESEVDVNKITDVTAEDALRRMKEAQSRRLKGYENEGKALPKPSL